MPPSARSAGELLCRLGILAAVAVQVSKRLADPDLPWHLALGRYMAAAGEIPQNDPLAVRHSPIRYMEFVSDLALWGVMRLGGTLGLQLLGGLLLALLCLLLLGRSRGTGPIAFAALALALGAIGNWVLVRPATLSFLLLAGLTWLLDAHRRNPACRAFLALPLLVAVWVNVHGFSVLGALLIAAYAGYRGACRLARGRLGPLLPEADGAGAGRALLVAGAALAATGLNLAGYRLLTAPFRIGTEVHRISEWQRPTLSFLVSHEVGVIVFALVALAALLFGREDDGRRWPCAYDLGLFVVAAFIAQSAVRMIPVAVILVAPLVARRIANRTPVTPLLHVAAAALVPLAAPVMLVQNPTSFGLGWEPAHFPEGAVRFVERSQPRGQMWNFHDHGGYLSLRLYPEHLVLIDGRTTWVHDLAFLNRYHAGLRDPVAFEELAREQHLEWALVRARPGEPFGAPIAASAAWSMVYLDATAAVYVRRDGPNAELAARGYRALRHLTPPPMALDAALTGSVSAAALDHDARLAVEQDPGDPRAWFFEGAAAVAARDAARWARAKARLSELAPGHRLIGVFDAAAAAAARPP